MVKLRVLIVDDTVVYRALLKRILVDLPDVEVVGTASNGKIALQLIASKQPDLLVLDVEMPVMDGIETLSRLKKDYPDVGVVMVSGSNASTVKATMSALELGAFDFVEKPVTGSSEESHKALGYDLRRVLQSYSTTLWARLARNPEMFSRRKVGRDISDAEARRSTVNIASAVATPVKISRGVLPAMIKAVVIGISTGGPNALNILIPKLPKNFPVPILMVQHMPPLFTKSLAVGLNKKSAIRVVEASAGEVLEAGTVYIAPGGKHMILIDPECPTQMPRIGLHEGERVQSCRPSADVLFKSVGKHFHGNVLALVMTGMGADACDGVAALKKLGAYCIIQDEATCTIYGMPRAVAEAGLADESLPLEQLADRMVSIVPA